MLFTVVVQVRDYSKKCIFFANVNKNVVLQLSHGFSLRNSSPKKPKIRHHCRHFEQYSAARPHFRDVIPSYLEILFE